MWKDFNIEDYAPPRSVKTYASMSTGEANKENAWNGQLNGETDDTWSPVITIPKPFKMTLREAKKQKKLTPVSNSLQPSDGITSCYICPGLLVNR
jgi:hypothetical protein